MICNLPPVAILLPTTLHAHVVAKCAATAPQPPPPPHIHPVKLPPPTYTHRGVFQAKASTTDALCALLQPHVPHSQPHPPPLFSHPPFPLTLYTQPPLTLYMPPLTLYTQPPSPCI